MNAQTTIDKRCSALAHDALCFARLTLGHAADGHDYTANRYAIHVADLAERIIAARTFDDIGECARSLLSQFRGDVDAALHEARTFAAFSINDAAMCSRYRTAADDLVSLTRLPKA